MKKSSFNVVKVFSAPTVVAAFCVAAQAWPGLIAKVPFDFVVCNSTLPAGDTP